MPDLLRNTKPIFPDTDHSEKPSPFEPPRKKSRRLLVSVIILIVVVLFIGLGFLTKVVLAINSTNANSGKKIGFFEQIAHLISNPENSMTGEQNDRINIILAGIGGAGHDGAYLADTIIVASIKPSTNEVALLSIPRDLYVEIPGFGWRKINNALAFGNESGQPGNGELLLKQVVEKVTGLTIPYYARLDFEGFRKAIDDLGGVDVYVDNSFTDVEYPDYKHGYQTISFKKGLEHMNGERALQFVRSRHGNNGEGSDFARSKRQQKVLFAAKQKLFSLGTFLNPNGIVSAIDDLGNHNQTNLQVWEMSHLVQLVKDTTNEKIITQVLDTGTDGILVSETTVDGAYILRPKSGTYKEIQYLAQNIFNVGFINRENARIEIQNATSESGLGYRTGELLKSMSYNIVKVSTAKLKEPLATTTIYDLTAGQKPYTVVSLKNALQAEVSSNLPAFMTNEQPIETIGSPLDNVNVTTPGGEVDIVIVIGQDRLTPTELLNRP